jgi:hypothetical protein
MAWLGRRTLVVMISVATLLIAVRLVGTRSGSFLPVIFTYADGSPCRHPCLFGAEPGRMSSDEIVTTLSQHPITRRMRISKGGDVADFVLEAKGVTILVGTGAAWMYISRSVNDNPFDALPGAPDDLLALGSFGEVIATFGPPEHFGLVSGISFWDQFPAVISLYPGKHLQFIHRRIPSDTISPNAPLAQIVVWPTTASVTIQGDMQPWSGFGRANRYPVQP